MGHSLCCAGENRHPMSSLGLGHRLHCLLPTLLRALCTSFYHQLSLRLWTRGREVMSSLHHLPISQPFVLGSFLIWESFYRFLSVFLLLSPQPFHPWRVLSVPLGLSLSISFSEPILGFYFSPSISPADLGSSWARDQSQRLEVAALVLPCVQ